MLRLLKGLGFAALVLATIAGFVAFAVAVMLAGMWLTSAAPGATFEARPKPPETRPSPHPAYQPDPSAPPAILAY
jgi:hypothetical protein